MRRNLLSSAMFDETRPWLALIAAAVAASVGVGLLVFALESRGVDVLPGRLGGAQVPEAAPPQAPWEIRSITVGLGVADRNARRRIKEQRPNLRALVKDVYDATLFPQTADRDVIRDRFVPGAARSWMDADVGLPDGAELGKSLSRVARIAIYGSGAQAAARVRVVMHALVRGRRVRIVHLSTLWLARREGSWKVIGFEVDQGRVA